MRLSEEEKKTSGIVHWEAPALCLRSGCIINIGELDKFQLQNRNSSDESSWFILSTSFVPKALVSPLPDAHP